MAPKNRLLYVGKHPIATVERMLAAGSIVDADDPAALEHPNDFVEAPPRDGTWIVVNAAIVRDGSPDGRVLRAGEILSKAEASKYPGLCLEGPIEDIHLGPLGVAVSYNTADNVAARKRDHDEGLAKRRARAEAAARDAASAASHAQRQADDLRERADKLAAAV